MINQRIIMEFKINFLITFIVIAFTFINRIKCSSEFDFSSSTSSSGELGSSEELNFLNRINNEIIREAKLLQSEDLEESITKSSKKDDDDSDSSKTAMDIITIIWYTSTFLALAAFFFLMACSDRRCGRRNSSSGSVHGRGNGDDSAHCPPSPAPSYREFAPPSYESVMKKEIYVIPVHHSINITKDNIFNKNETELPDNQNAAGNTTKLEFVNEQGKTG